MGRKLLYSILGRTGNASLTCPPLSPILLSVMNEQITFTLTLLTVMFASGLSTLAWITWRSNRK